MMKKVLMVCTAALLALLLSGCVDQEAQRVIDKINSIGEIDTSDISVIEEGRELYDALTEDQKKQVNNIGKLEEAESQLPELKKAFAVENDTTPPTFEGYKEGDTVEVKAGTELNLNEYLGETLSITDDVTEGEIPYRTDCDSDAYDGITGRFDTQDVVECPLVLVAADEAGNEATLNLTLKIVPIHVTKDDPTPVVYEGEYGTIKIDGFEHSSKYGEPGYHIYFDVTNGYDKPIEVYLSSSYTTINKYQVGSSFIVNSIPPDTRGKMEALIADSNIPDDIGEYSTIESKVAINEKDGDESFYKIPIVFDVNVSQ